MVEDPNTALIDSWRLSLHDKRPRTVGLYVDCARIFTEWLASTGRSPDLLAVTRRDVEAWFAHQTDVGLSQSTKRSRWIALRSLYRFLHDEEEIDADPMAGVKVAKADPAPVAVLSDDDLAKMFAACSGTDFHSRRDLAILRTLAATGLRLAEVAGLEVADVDLATRLVVVRHAKADRTRVGRIDPTTAAAIDRYKRRRARHRLASSPALWLGDRGVFTRKGIAGMVSARAKQAGLGHVHPHQLRHTWAHRWLAKGGNEGDLQKLGGWSNGEVMRRYGSSLAVDRALANYDNVMRDL